LPKGQNEDPQRILREFYTLPRDPQPSFGPQIAIATQVGLIHDSDQEELNQKTKQIGGTLHGLIKSLPQHAPKRKT